MRLSQLIDERFLPAMLKDAEVKALSLNSAHIEKASVFFALNGQKSDGRTFIGQALQKGALCAVCEKGDLPKEAAPFMDNGQVIVVDNVRHVLALAAQRFYQRQPRHIVAVTGTSGKTSVVSFYRQIMDGLGFEAASLGTVGLVSRNINDYASLTTPDAISLQALLRHLADEGVDYLALEASSHGIEQHRLDGVCLKAAAFTNLGHDHLDYHHNMDDYFLAKMALFDRLLPKDKPAILFSDDIYSPRAIDHVQKAGRQALTVGEKGTFIRLKHKKVEADKQILALEYDGSTYQVRLPLMGNFQVYNALVAAGLALVSGADKPHVFAMLEKLEGAPGRLEYIGAKMAAAKVYVDYAHKPEALENVLSALRAVTPHRLIVVFGCGGDRDRQKRKIMGEIAQRLADIVIITDDNPRSEDSGAIRREIMGGAPNGLEIGDRRAAIAKAIAMMQEGDSVLVAGKGHERGQIIGDKVLPFSDRDTIIELLDQIK